MKKIILTLSALLTLGATTMAETRSDKSDVASNIAVFSSIIKQLQTQYVDSIDIDEVVKSGIDAMLFKLDPYTEYFDESEQKDFRDRNAGEYAGIGSYIMERDGYVWLSGPNVDSPAAKAGLRTGDKILRIDGEDMAGKTTEQVSAKLRGSIGSKVTVDVMRPYTTDSLLTLVVERDKIQIPAVPYFGVIGNNIGYIQLSQYSEPSANEVRDALQSLMRNNNIKGLVLDLRGNGGGYLESAVKILGLFLPKGTEVLRTRGRNLLDERIYKTTEKPIAPNLPLVVLTDGTTASASEITAGAIQDLDRGVVVGMRTYGKGLVQSPYGLPFNGMIKITTAKYYIPSGRLIQAIDYSHRAADGSATRIADSLTNVFTTAAGRTVRDGGGITPDVKVEYPEVNRITYNIVVDHWAFDFANKYRAEHPDVPQLADIVADDSLYSQFKSFIDPTRFNYDKVCETAMSALRELAKNEGYLTEEVDSQLTRLDGMMKHSLSHDLDTHRQAIAPYLEQEIAERYYYTPGRVKVSLRNDKMVSEALDILDNPERYAAILRPQKEDNTQKK